MRKILNRVGEISYNNFGSKMTIIEYKTNNNLLVKFENGYVVKNNYWNFTKGNIVSPYEKRNCGVGYLSEGIHENIINNIKTQEYSLWANMLKRCYHYNVGKRNYVYKDCSVCEEWYNFQNFAEWYKKNFYQIENEKMELDKDILVKGNKIYSPVTCIFVPRIINTLFTKSNKTRGKYPIGVSSVGNKYVSNCNIPRQPQKYLGKFSSIEEAFQAYKQFKEVVIKEIAEKYRNQIPEKLYNALLEYQVEIKD